jgi:protocatechuate 3,4-dioxygenase beta subunit
MYFPDEDANAADGVLASLPEEERRRLVAGPGLQFDIRLQGPEQTPFFAV